MSINQGSAEDVPDTVAEPLFINFRAALGMNEHAWRQHVLERLRRLGDTAWMVDKGPVGAHRLLAMQAMRRDVDYDEMPDVLSEDSDDELYLVSESEGG